MPTINAQGQTVYQGGEQMPALGGGTNTQTNNSASNGSNTSIQGPGGQVYNLTPGTSIVGPLNSGYHVFSQTPAGQQPSVSTTTISNANKINQVPQIQATTANLSNTGITSNPQTGSAQYANGESYNPLSPNSSQSNSNSQNSQSTTSTGGYIGNTWYPAGATLPTDSNGNVSQTSDYSTTDQQILDGLNQQKAQADALSATAISAVQSSYQNLITQQQQASATNLRGLQQSLIASGNSQTSPYSAANSIQAQINYGTQQIATLTSQEQTAVIQAQQAQQNQDFQLQDAINTKLSDIQAQKVATANTLQATITAAASKLADQQFQVQQTLNGNLTSIAEAAAKNGASPAILAQINSATSVDEALSAAGQYAEDSSSASMNDYLNYKNGAESKGLTPQSYTSWSNQQDANKAYSDAYASEEAKNQADSAIGALTSQQQQNYTKIDSDLQADSQIKQFSTIQGSYQKIQNLTTTTDPASQAAALAALVQMAVPGTKSLRGSASMFSSAFGSTLGKALISAQKTIEDHGPLTPQDVQSLQAAATTLYNDAQKTVQQTRQTYVDQATQNGIPNADKILYNPITPPDPATTVNNYVSKSGTTKLTAPITLSNGQTANTTGDLIAALYSVPGATDANVLAYMQAKGYIPNSQ